MKGGEALITSEEILEIALCFLDQPLTEGERGVLTTLCGAANDFWQERLRDEVDPAAFRGLYCLACAYSALGHFHDGRQSGQTEAVSFRLGDFSLDRRGAETSAVRRSLQAQAESLMAPFTTDGDFAFLEVLG